MVVCGFVPTSITFNRLVAQTRFHFTRKSAPAIQSHLYFFLRFLISTLAHVGFGGLMGGLLTRGVFQIYQPQRFRLLVLAFVLSWFLHGLYDLLLGINQTMYAVLLLLPPLLTLVVWMGKREYFLIERNLEGKVLVQKHVAESSGSKIMNQYFSDRDSPWNKNAPWLREKRLRYTVLRDIESSTHE